MFSFIYNCKLTMVVIFAVEEGNWQRGRQRVNKDFTYVKHYLRRMPTEFDNADLALLRLLQSDARRSLRELAREMGVSAPTAAAKVRSLEAKGVLRGYPASIAPEALGQHVVHIVARVKPADAPGVARKMAAMPEVRQAFLLGSGRVAATATLVDAPREQEFMRGLSALKEIQGLDAFPVVDHVKDMPLAVIDRGVRLTVKCEFCGRRTSEGIVRVKFMDVLHFVCCASCKAGFLERAQRLRKLADRSGRRSQLPMAGQ